MKVIPFLQQSAKVNILQKDAAHFSRQEYEDHLKNVCSLLTDSQKPNIRMLQVPFCVNLWNIDLPSSLYSYSLSHKNSSLVIFNNAEIFSASSSFEDFIRTAPHQHNYYEFIYIYHGDYSHTINGKTYHYHKNQCLMLEPGIYHTDSNFMQSDCTIIFFCISRTFYNALCTQYDVCNTDCSESEKNNRPQIISGSDKPEANFFVYTPLNAASIDTTRLLAEQLIEEIVQNNFGCELVSEGLFYRLVGLLFQKRLYSCEQQTISFRAQDRLNTSEELQAYLWMRNGQATRSELTEQFNYCADYLNRLLKIQTGYTISKYNQHISLKRAEQMLRETDINITEIISELGFENKSFFYRLFEKNTGMTPNTYRQIYQKSKCDT